MSSETIPTVRPRPRSHFSVLIVEDVRPKRQFRNRHGSTSHARVDTTDAKTLTHHLILARPSLTSPFASLIFCIWLCHHDVPDVTPSRTQGAPSVLGTGIASSHSTTPGLVFFSSKSHDCHPPQGASRRRRRPLPAPWTTVRLVAHAPCQLARSTFRPPDCCRTAIKREAHASPRVSVITTGQFIPQSFRLPRHGSRVRCGMSQPRLNLTSCLISKLPTQFPLWPAPAHISVESCGRPADNQLCFGINTKTQLSIFSYSD